jgi:hypothetical protein
MDFVIFLLADVTEKPVRFYWRISCFTYLALTRSIPSVMETVYPPWRSTAAVENTPLEYILL